MLNWRSEKDRQLNLRVDYGVKKNCQRWIICVITVWVCVFVRGSLKRFESVSAFFNECDIMQQRMERQRDDDILSA